MKHRIALALTFAVLASACFGTETGNPPFTTSAGFSGHSPMGIAPDPVIDDAWWSVGYLAFSNEEECEIPAADPQLEGPVTVQLTETGGDPTDLQLEEGEYCGVAIRLEPASAPLPSGAPARLDGASVVIDGTARGGAPVRVTLRSVFEVLMTADAAGGGFATFPLAPDEPPIVIGVDWTLLFAGVSLADAETTDGEIRIDEDHNAALLSTLETNLPGAMAVYRDLDADGVLDPEEARETPLARF